MFAFNSKFALLVTAVAGLQLAGTSAQTLSSGCQSTLAGLVASPDASCLNAQALVGLVLSSGSDGSVVPTVNTWLTGLCSKAACSNDVLATVVQNVTAGCQSDLSAAGLSGLNAAQLTSLVQTAYPTVREVACLADTKNNNQLCVTELLTDIQSSTGTLSVNSLEGLLTNFEGSGAIPNIPNNVTCSECSKAAYSVISKDLGSLLPSDVGSSLQSTCGDSFVDGSSPSDITQLASGSSSSTTVTPNGAVPALSFAPVVGIAASVLVAASSAFVVLA